MRINEEGKRQSGTATYFGNTTFHNFIGMSGTNQPFGNTDLYHFNHGQSAMIQQFSNTEFYNFLNGRSATWKNFGGRADGRPRTSQQQPSGYRYEVDSDLSAFEG